MDVPSTGAPAGKFNARNALNLLETCLYMSGMVVVPYLMSVVPTLNFGPHTAGISFGLLAGLKVVWEVMKSK